MPNIISSGLPPQEKSIQIPNTPIDRNVLDAGISLKSAEFANYLNLKEEMFNVDVMQKVIELTNEYEDIDALMEVDVNLEDTGMTKLDALYAYTQLLKQEKDLKKKHELVKKAKQKYIITN